MIFPSEYIAWDLETTGFDPVENKIIEIGMIHMRGEDVVEQRSWFISGNVVPEEITKITTITQEMVDGGVPLANALAEFMPYLVRVGFNNLTHNGFRFDIPFLVQSLGYDGAGRTIGEVEEIKTRLYANGIDSAALFKARQLKMERRWNENFAQYAKRVLDTKAPGVKYNVGFCCGALGIDTSNMTMHRALGDVFLTNQIYKKLITK